MAIMPDRHSSTIASSVCLSRHGMKLPHHPEDMSSADTAQGLTVIGESRVGGKAPYGQVNAEGRVDEHVDGR